ncbi:hypothetical protein DLAC_00854 [Tieghemostelium lacteum]|uniref:Uncharacterized protein n=1 Tax=Tieghemostelium lacteum TaxID=361077 RepID=A0A152A7F3_TIELA|nr:hypothetical protein DLAC_00854 [Tieghemostelium lacteum]|eukprot:KYR02055.1 hypothetical protein DLAC_00854 [Tieghemostelium lacteum]
MFQLNKSASNVVLVNKKDFRKLSQNDTKKIITHYIDFGKIEYFDFLKKKVKGSKLKVPNVLKIVFVSIASANDALTNYRSPNNMFHKAGQFEEIQKSKKKRT